MSGVITDPPREIGVPLILILEFDKAAFGILDNELTAPSRMVCSSVLLVNVCAVSYTHLTLPTKA